MRNVTAIVCWAISILSSLSASAYAADPLQPIVCGTQATLKVRFDGASWPEQRGTALASGAVLAHFAGEAAEPLNLACARQGGSSMRPWWQCGAVLDAGKEISVVLNDWSGPVFADVFLTTSGQDTHRLQLPCTPAQ